MEDKHLSIRISELLYQKYVKEAIRQSNEEGKIIKVSEIIREVLSKGLNEKIN